jgi:hypothetical protein
MKYTNNGASKVTSAITGTGSLSNFQLTPGTGGLFPEIIANSGNYFYATLSDSNGNVEIVKVTKREGDVFSCTRAQDGTTARTWPANTDFQLRITRAMLDEISHQATDVQHFVTLGSSTWTKPANARMIFVQIWQPGAGGGSGRRRAIANQSTAASGGGGGSGGGYSEHWIPATAVTNTVNVVVGAGSNGGAAQTADNTNGTNGQSISSDSKFFITAASSQAGAGPGGIAGDTQRALPADVTFAYASSVFGVRDGRGAAGAAGSGTTATSGLFGGGGGGGGGGYAANGTSTGLGGWGAMGGAIYGQIGGVNQPGTSGGDNADRQFVVPNVPQPALYDQLGGGGGGGGNALAFTSGAASSPGQNGGKGGWPGGGGGGGSASQGSNSGAGGKGGDGYVRVTTFF